MTDILVIAGLSGAGRSQAADSLEDQGPLSVLGTVVSKLF